MLNLHYSKLTGWFILIPVPSATISLAVYAPESKVCAVFQQRIFLSWALLVFYSKKLSNLETPYSAFYCDVLAATLPSVTSGSCWMVDSSLYLLTSNHKNTLLRFLRSGWLGSKDKLSFISEFTSSIQHLPGSENMGADALSHPAVWLHLLVPA